MGRVLSRLNLPSTCTEISPTLRFKISLRSFFSFQMMEYSHVRGYFLLFSLKIAVLPRRCVGWDCIRKRGEKKWQEQYAPVCNNPTPVFTPFTRIAAISFAFGISSNNCPSLLQYFLFPNLHPLPPSGNTTPAVWNLVAWEK